MMNELPLKEASEFPIFDVGFALAFGLLHLLLYLFYPRQRANMFFSLFVFSAGLRIFTADVLDISRMPNQIAVIFSYIAIFSIAASVFSFVAFLYAAFEEHIPVYFWIVMAVWMLGWIARFFITGDATLLLQSLSLLIILFIAVESLRVVGRAIWHKRDGAWIVGLGVLFLIVAPLQIGYVIAFNQGRMSHFWSVLNTQISLCGIIIANSIFLSRNFARTSRNLEEQLVHVKELSARELEHERTAAELRLQNEQERAKLALVEQELALAASIQQALFPESLPKIAGYEVAAFNRPARDCGGDYYEVLKLEETGESYLLCVADVSGKGLPAALLMSNMQAALRALAGRAETLGELAVEINNLLYDTSPPDKFVTAVLLKINALTGEAKYVNAGHNECFLLRQDGGETELLVSTGLPLGMFGGRTYDEKSFHFAAGDLLALFSDGVSEAYDRDEREWGEENLQKCLKQVTGDSAEIIVKQVVAEIDNFANGAAQHDDITLLILKPMKL